MGWGKKRLQAFTVRSRNSPAATQFLGYETLTADGLMVTALIKNGSP